MRECSILSALLVQFRARYPQGCLNVDLLSSDLARDVAIVKVTALSTALEGATGVGLVTGPLSDLRSLVARAKLDALADLGIGAALEPAPSVDPFIASLYASPTFASAQEHEPQRTYLPPLTVPNVCAYFCKTYHLTASSQQARQWDQFKAHCLGTILPDDALTPADLETLHAAIVEQAKTMALACIDECRDEVSA